MKISQIEYVLFICENKWWKDFTVIWAGNFG